VPFFSIQLNSNRPKQIVVLFDNIEATADRPSDIEVLLHIDKGDSVMEELVAREQSRRSFHLRILQTDLVKGYATLWKPLNPLWKMTSPDVYFVINISDEMLFETKGWDKIVRRYEGYYPDHIFRLRGSKYRFRNYSDFWECGFAPDSLAFYTRRWLELSGDWNPCLGPDSFQQCVAFYLVTSDPFSRVQFNRDIPLTELRFIGEGAGIGLEGRARYKQIIINNRAWFILMSHRMQQEARRRAMRMKAHMIAYAAGGQGKCEVKESAWRRHFTILSLPDRLEIARVKYSLSWLRISLTNLTRMRHVLYYAGGGKRALNYPAFGLFLMLTTYLPKGVDMLTWIMDTRCARDRFKTRLRLILRYPVRRCAEFWTRCARCWARSALYLNRLRDIIHRQMARDEPQYSMNHFVLRISVGRAMLYIATGVYAVLLRARRLISPFARHVLMPVRPLTRTWTGRFRKFIGKHVKAIPNIRISVPYPQRMAHRFKRGLIRPIAVVINGCFTGVEGVAAYLSKVRCTLPVWLRQDTIRRWQPVDCGAPSGGPTTQATGTVFSIQLSSNRPHTILDTLNSIELMADEPSRIEVIIRITEGDVAMKTLIKREQSTRRIKLRYLATYPVNDFEDQWKVANVMFQMSDRDAYFVAFISDETRFETKGWDTLLMQYIGYYPDHIFRVRASKYRFRNYRDYWECGFAPDSLTFHTRRWLAIQGGSNTCPEPAALQQCVSYYLFRSDPFSHVQYHRDLVAPFIAFSGDGAGVTLERDAREPRLLKNRREWLFLMSHAMQEDAKRRAMHLKAAIMRQAPRDENGPVSLVFLESQRLRQIRIEHEDGTLVEVLSYRLSRRAIRLTTFFRVLFFHYYSGGGNSFRYSRHSALVRRDSKGFLPKYTAINPPLSVAERSRSLRNQL